MYSFSLYKLAWQEILYLQNMHGNLYDNFVTEQIVLFTTGYTQLHGVRYILEQNSLSFFVLAAVTAC